MSGFPDYYEFESVEESRSRMVEDVRTRGFRLVSRFIQLHNRSTDRLETPFRLRWRWH